MDITGYNPKLVDRFRDRDRHRPAPYNVNVDVLGRKPGGNKSPPYNRVFISNIPYEETWQDLKDLFRDKVGEVTYVELMTDEQGHSKGYGIVEFKTKELAAAAVEKMKGHTLKDRNLVVKEDFFGDFLAKALRRDAQKNPQSNTGYGMTPLGLPSQGLPLPHMGDLAPTSLMPAAPPGIRDHGDRGGGLDQTIMDITGGAPLGNTVFVANLDYSVTYPKLKEVFSLAGNVTKIDLLLDNDNKSRGMANITFETDLEAVQAISMFNQQMLFDRPMVVKMDKGNVAKPEKSLPSGLQSIGPSLNLTGLSDSYSRQGSSKYGDSRNGSSGVGALGDGLFSKKTTPDSIYGLNLDSLSAGITKAQVGASSYSGRSGLGDMYSSLVGGKSSLGMRDSHYGQHVSGMPYSSTERRQSSGQSSGNISKPPPGSSSSVYVVNLPYSIAWKEIKDIFSEVGNVQFVEIKMENGKSKGQAQIRFDNPAAAAKAVQRFNGSEINGRNVKVHLSF